MADFMGVDLAEDTRTCQRCEEPLPQGSRTDRKWCGRACQSQANRRATGQVVENNSNCPSCGVSLAGMYQHARVCRSPRCRMWTERHPGVPHPTASARYCGWCAQSIDLLAGSAKYCSWPCRSAASASADRDRYNAKARKWQATTRGRDYRRNYQQANIVHRREWAREARQRNPERYRDYWKQWAEANPGAVQENSRVRRARKIGNPGSVGVSLRDWQWLVRHYRGCCAYCGEIADPLHMEHVIPLAKGGRHAIGNVLPACSECNFSKHAMLLVVWRYRRPKTRRITL